MNSLQNFREQTTSLLCDIQSLSASMALSSIAERVSSLRQSFENGENAKVVVVGEFNSGKSTLLNALCNQNILPTGILPTTATINILRNSPRSSIKIAFSNGASEEFPFSGETLTHFTARFGEQKDIRWVEIMCPDFPEGIEFIDTPGVNDINETRSELVYRMIPDAEVIIFLMDIQQPMKRSEAEFLRNRVLGETLVRTIFVLNHSDRVTKASEIGQVKSFVVGTLRKVYQDVADEFRRKGAEELAREVEKVGQQPPLFVISAKKMMLGEGAGDPEKFRQAMAEVINPLVLSSLKAKRSLTQAALFLKHLKQVLIERQAMRTTKREGLALSLDSQRIVLEESLKKYLILRKIIQDRGVELAWRSDQVVRGIFQQLDSELAVRLSVADVESAIKQIEQDLARELEACVYRINSGLQRLAGETSSGAMEIFRLGTVTTALNIQYKAPVADPIGDLFSDQVNQMGLYVLAPLLVFQFGLIGVAAVALPFILRLFSGVSPRGSDLVSQLRGPLQSTMEDTIREIIANIQSRVEAIVSSLPAIFDETQERIRDLSTAILETDQEYKAPLETCQSQIVSLERRLSQLSADAL